MTSFYTQLKKTGAIYHYLKTAKIWHQPSRINTWWHIKTFLPQSDNKRRHVQLLIYTLTATSSSHYVGMILGMRPIAKQNIKKRKLNLIKKKHKNSSILSWRYISFTETLASSFFRTSFRSRFIMLSRPIDIQLCVILDLTLRRSHRLQGWVHSCH